MSVHFGNSRDYRLSCLQKKYPVALIVVRLSNDFVDTMINDLRMKEGFNVINFQMDDKIPLGIL